MTNWRRALTSLAMLLVGVGVGATPRVPTDDHEIIERLPAAFTQQAAELRALREAWLANPADSTAALALTERYIALARNESDPRYYGAAEGVLAQAFGAVLPPRARVLRAAILQARHAFTEAMTELDTALAAAPRDAQAWLTRAAIQRVTGNYVAAKRSCVALAPLAEPMVATVCLASVGAVSGVARASEVMLARQVEQAPSADLGVQQWALTVLAELAMSRGQVAETEQAFQAALAMPVRNVYLKVTYADFLLQQRRPQDVLELLDDERQHDGALLRLALAGAALEAPKAEQDFAALKARFAAGRARGSTLHQGEEARFTLALLDDPATALQLALANWELQREPRDARVVLEAAVASRDRAAAKPVIDFLVANKSEDVGLRALIAALPPGN
jgi:hypothetical protein